MSQHRRITRAGTPTAWPPPHACVETGNPALDPATGHGPADQLRIGGLTPMTTVDYPGELASVVFCQGCPWHCAYCHNRHLIPAGGVDLTPWSDVRALLQRRRGLLDAVVFSGGEPTLQLALPAAIQETKALGFKVGLHTAGCYPRRIHRLLPVLDWVGLDIKAPAAIYPSVTGAPDSGDRAWESLQLLLRSGIELEVRTTVMPGWTLAEPIGPLMESLSTIGVNRFVLQQCRTDTGLGLPRGEPGWTALTTQETMDIGSRLFGEFFVRPA